jgi:hypothetical protein
MPNEALFVDLLEWLANGERTYDEVMEAWRSSCPRLTIWEDALTAGWVRRRGAAVGARIELTDEGRSWLASRGARAA